MYYIYNIKLKQTDMRTLDVIRFICLHKEITSYSIYNHGTEPDKDPLSAIFYFASIDPSNYDGIMWILDSGDMVGLVKITRY